MRVRPRSRRERRRVVREDAETAVAPPRPAAPPPVPPPDAPIDPGPGLVGPVDEEVGPRVVSEDERISVTPTGDVVRQTDRVEQEPVRRRRFDDLGWALLVLLILVIAGLAAWWYFSSRSTEKKLVPAVTSMPVATAVNTLQDRGFKAQIVNQVHGGKPGIVFAQRPQAGKKLKK